MSTFGPSESGPRLKEDQGDKENAKGFFHDALLFGGLEGNCLERVNDSESCERPVGLRKEFFRSQQTLKNLALLISDQRNSVQKSMPFDAACHGSVLALP